MNASGCRVYNIAPGGDFLHVLAHEILLGFPFANPHRENPPLPNWTILLPTRRAARILGSILGQESGQRAVLLPTIKPIGDIDDGRLRDDANVGDIPLAISRAGQLFMMLDILKNWAVQNPQTAIASEIQASQIQSLALASSLLQLVDQMETGETNFDLLSEAYNIELSEHRSSLLSLLGLLKIELPQRLLKENLMGPSARRSLLIRLEANRLAQTKLRGPIIAAGSTGTIPATRALLSAIAHHEQGAVILPGLDLQMTADDWSTIGPDHPQFSLQNLIADMKVERKDVVPLNFGNVQRNFVSAELMRPSATADRWHVTLKAHTEDINKALEHLHLISAPDRHLESRAIALILRHALETPKQTAALVTPDRDLARRVKAELRRWNIEIDDSAGEPLHHHGMACLASHVLQSVANGLTSAGFLALLSHADVSLGMSREEFQRNLANLEIVVLRGQGDNLGLVALQNSMARALEAKRSKARVHPQVLALTDDDWISLQIFLETVIAILAPLLFDKIQSAEQSILEFEVALNKLAPDADWGLVANQNVTTLMDELRGETSRLQNGRFSELAPIILHMLREKTLPTSSSSHPRLAIYGVLEARLVPADILILGGLNEGSWPPQPDPGPWLNRSMRTLFGMQLPERDIGLSAHDFTQCLGYDQVYITNAKRLDGVPKISSRWLLRLQTIIKAAGLNENAAQDNTWVELAQALDANPNHNPHTKPRPTPSPAVRPTHFSVTEVEKLIRDPYAIYAKKILKIEPLQNLVLEPDAALRGTLFHEALRIWNQQQEISLAGNPHQLLLNIGETLFEPLSNNSEIATFWWARFKRIAQWIAEVEPDFRQSLVRVHAEISGQIEFEISNITHKLTAKADRIDELANGKARIIDYKSGSPPTAKTVQIGISPQLPLEAAIVLAGGFKSLHCSSIAEVMYLHITGSTPAGAVKIIDAQDGQSLDDLAKTQLQGFKNLLFKYQNPTQAYLPRAAIQKEEETTDHDHLSRYKEWILAGEG